MCVWKANFLHRSGVYKVYLTVAVTRGQALERFDIFAVSKQGENMSFLPETVEFVCKLERLTPGQIILAAEI